MKTKIVRINSDQKGLDKKQIQEELNALAQIIKEGGLVAIPTETVYGLAADGLNPKAIAKIFEAKNRPMDNPLILHLSQIEDIHPLVEDVESEILGKLDALWPGPLTVVFKKSHLVPKEISAGLNTVAIRIPAKKLTRDFIKACGVPLAAPSANLSTKPSPTDAASVLEDLDGIIDAVLDGGPTNIGLESTVLDLTAGQAKILRPGYFTREMLSAYWPEVDYDLALKNSQVIPKSPGQKYKHYAPNAKVRVYVGEAEAFSKKADELIKNTDQKIGLMLFDEDQPSEQAYETFSLGSMAALDTMAARLFSGLRYMDQKGVDLILVHGVKEEGFGLSIMNRLKKAASGNVYNLGGNE